MRVMTLAVTAFLPGAIKRAILRLVFGFRIGKRVRLGIAYFDCTELTIEDDASIGHGAIFKNVGSVRIGRFAVVGPLNLFRGGDRIELDDYAQLLRLNVINAIPHHDCYGLLDSTFVLGYGAVVASSHWIDFTDRVSIGRRSMLGGRNSSIWTHNRRRAAPVRIGDFCYMGSETRIAPGVTIPDCSVVAMGSVVSSPFTATWTFIGGAPARITRRLTEADADTLFGKTRWDLPEEAVPVIPVGDGSYPAAIPVSWRSRRPRRGEDAVGGQIRRIVAEAAKTSPDQIDFHHSFVEQGIDSLQLIVLREMLESALDVQFSDEAWMRMERPAHIVAYLERDAAPIAPASVTDEPASIRPVAAQASTRPTVPIGLSVDDLEVGMPLTGRNNLAETPLLQRLGDQRWRHISDVMGVPSRDIVDDEGHRLYATFFYVETAFPPAKPMAAFGENDRFKVVSTLTRYGTSMVDGVSFLMPGDYVPGDHTPFRSLEDAVAAGIPAARLSNIFVRQFAGAEWLKKGRPADPRFVRIPALEQAPDSYALVKRAEKEGRFGPKGARWIPITDGPVRREYRLVPDRDLNGAGLVYFANYTMFLDICERDVLLTGNLPLSDALVDQRTLVRRRSAYLNNASARDTLLIDVEPWLEVPMVQTDTARDAPIRLHVNCRMYRRSDDRLMMVSTAEKAVMGSSIADVPFAAEVSAVQTAARFGHR